MIWMAVTADDYELPIVVAKTSRELAEKMNVKQSTISCMESRYRRGITKGIKNTKPTKYGEYYRVVKVKEISE